MQTGRPAAKSTKPQIPNPKQISKTQIPKRSLRGAFRVLTFCLPSVCFVWNLGFGVWDFALGIWDFSGAAVTERAEQRRNATDGVPYESEAIVAIRRPMSSSSL
jgi:hypothetical protein